jgi:hypothetical protein
MRLTLCGIAALILIACASEDSELRKHADAIASLRATTVAVSDAWLVRSASATYARIALDQTFRLVQKERVAVAATPDDLARPAANVLARESEQLSRVIAALARHINNGDADAVRRLTEEVRTESASRP